MCESGPQWREAGCACTAIDTESFSFLTFSFTPSSIYDPVGMIVPSLKCIAWNGRAIVVGFAAGSIESASFPAP